MRAENNHQQESGNIMAGTLCGVTECYRKATTETCRRVELLTGHAWAYVLLCPTHDDNPANSVKILDLPSR